jgi:hypothetical protein
MSRSAIFTATLTAAGGSDAIRALRGTLKLALRRFGLRAVDVRKHATVKVSRCRAAQAVRTTTHSRRQEKMTMDMRKYSGTVFLKFGDVKAGPLRVVIVDVTEGKFGRPDLEFSDGTKLSLNATNTRTLVTSYGGESSDWVNKEVELSPGEVEYDGQMQETVVVKPISPPRRKPGGEIKDEIPF